MLRAERSKVRILKKDRGPISPMYGPEQVWLKRYL